MAGRDMPEHREAELMPPTPPRVGPGNPGILVIQKNEVFARIVVIHPMIAVAK